MTHPLFLSAQPLPPPVLYDQSLRIIEAEGELDITMFSDSVAINGTLHKSSFIEHIAMVQSNEDARISVFDKSEMRVSQVIQPKASRMWMSFDFSLDLIATICTKP